MAGNIHIIRPPENFLKVSKDIIFNEDVDFESLGIYVKVIALGNRWKLNISGLAHILHISTDKVRKHFAVLEKAGYLRRYRAKDEKGKFVGWDYEVSCVPFTDSPASRHRENADIGKAPTSGFSGTNIDIYSINKEYNITTTTPPAADDVAGYVRSRGWADPEGFALYYITHNELGGWRKKNGEPIVNWKQNILQWERYHKDDIFTKPAGQGGHPMTEEEYRKYLQR